MSFTSCVRNTFFFYISKTYLTSPYSPHHHFPIWAYDQELKYALCINLYLKFYCKQQSCFPISAEIKHLMRYFFNLNYDINREMTQFIHNVHVIFVNKLYHFLHFRQLWQPKEKWLSRQLGHLSANQCDHFNTWI